jgi:hypothetical protein
LPGPVDFTLLISALNSTLKPAFFEAAKAGMFPAPRGNFHAAGSSWLWRIRCI